MRKMESLDGGELEEEVFATLLALLLPAFTMIILTLST
jgi:hypothetical protein